MHISFSQKGKSFLNLENIIEAQKDISERIMALNQANQVYKLNNHSLSPVPEQLWFTSSNDIGKIKLAIPTEIPTDESKPLSSVCQYPLKFKLTNGI